MGTEYLLGVFLLCCGSFLGPGTGVDDGELHGCPPTPNCISSESWRFNYIHKVEPIVYKDSKEATYHFLANKFDGMENVYVSEKKENEYIRLVYFTKVFRFPDKVEFYFEPEEKIIQVRSQSIFGLWDVFANRIRIALIRRDIELKEENLETN
ncbi:DUF1499 domain-containing protein [Leptospira ognonensis]|uniref:DUF1499 domain-containing protein n=1 Tax=Leptospira ognonensis TaxID=2484945 RepID=A0A4V3JRY5_9LEPT|nr:DUF1499 domain-containing protein [Leptospira ognonensis]TGL62221.1 DUF1499 domain-containing protein [Leptospira ognonensis]